MCTSYWNEQILKGKNQVPDIGLDWERVGVWDVLEL